ncbi:Nramp family divalent metal transporter [Sphingosinicella terrae]|uniref:Nramp family divalent metal transporter n=1 Tax=Sphingosinicella terrae TaxID=2172047 RepID=UPI000E0D3314|nr:Nramp family divalent metal transporter [Sphingosinicella terrae]
MGEEAAGGRLGEYGVAELPPPPRHVGRIIGPGVVAAGVGLASGEFILYPYIASQVGLVFVWAAALGLATQYFINMEIERYTLATGETVLTGFSRLGRHWGLVFVLLAFASNLWPGWATSAATLVTFLLGGSVSWIAIGMLVAIGLILTLSPVVYRSLERTQFLKVLAVGALVLIAAVAAIPGPVWAEAPARIADVRLPTAELGWALLLGALAYAGAGGGQNLCQSNWIRDKGFGMGAHAPRIVSPFTGEPVAAPGTGWRFEPTPEAMEHWRRWWRFANAEQLATFVAISFVTILFTSLLAYATLSGRDDLPRDISFLAVEGEALSERVGPWFGRLFWAVGAFSLFAAALGIVDYSSRLAADVLRTSYLQGRSESVLYAALVWGLVLIGITIIASGLTQPLVLLVIAGCVAAFMMVLYSALLIRLNRRLLAPPLRPAPYRIAALIWATGLFGILSAITVYDQARRLLGG